MRNLAEASLAEQKAFLDSFDEILSDIDGVVWYIIRPIEGSISAFNTLKKIGKEVHFVTNNCLYLLNDLHQKFLAKGLAIEKDDIVMPTLAMIDYLTTINFQKEIFVIGFTALKTHLAEAGFKLADTGPAEIESNLIELLKNINDNENVGAVICDADINLNFLKIQKVVTYLKREDVIFITGPEDPKAPLSDDIILVGPKFYLDVIRSHTQRQSISLAKPSLNYNNYIRKKYGIKDPSRVLFVGDTITEDMRFAQNCGYQKLLVLSGLTKERDLLNWKHPEELKPEYYVERMGVLEEIIEKLQQQE